MPTPLSGDDILASDIKIPLFKNKAVAQNVTNSAVLVNDADFQIPLGVGTYEITLFVVAFLSGGTAAGVQLAWANTGTMTSLGRSCLGPAMSATASVTDTNMRSSVHGLSTAISYGLGSSNSGAIREDLMISVTVAGTLTLQWAQAVATAAITTTLSTTSRIRIAEIEDL